MLKRKMIFYGALMLAISGAAARSYDRCMEGCAYDVEVCSANAWLNEPTAPGPFPLEEPPFNCINPGGPPQRPYYDTEEAYLRALGTYNGLEAEYKKCRSEFLEAQAAYAVAKQRHDAAVADYEETHAEWQLEAQKKQEGCYKDYDACIADCPEDE